MFARSLRQTLFAAASLFVCASVALANTSATDQGTPAALQGGAKPYGSYGGGDFDRINTFNGALSLAIPLVVEDGRAGMGVTVLLSYTNKLWHSENTGDAQNPSYGAYFNVWDKNYPELERGWS